MTDSTTTPPVRSLGVASIPGILDEETLSHLLEVELARARRYEHPFSLMRVDVAPERSDVLRHAAGALRLHTRWADSVGAYEGGGLLIVLRDTAAEAARAAALKLRVAVEREIGAEAAAVLHIQLVAWRKGDDRERLLTRFKPLDYDA